MSYSDPFSHIGNVKGIGEELPLLRLKYITAQNDSPQKTASDNALVVQSLEENYTGKQAKPIIINYTSSGGASSLGTDQMVSYASVIHELAYGRITADFQNSTGEMGYPVTKDYLQHDLDIFV
jgi:hypothetical protein